MSAHYCGLVAFGQPYDWVATAAVFMLFNMLPLLYLLFRSLQAPDTPAAVFVVTFVGEMTNKTIQYSLCVCVCVCVCLCVCV